MNKQKLPDPNDPSIKPPKLPKITSPSCIQTQPLSQSIKSTQLIDPNAALTDNFDQLAQIWNSAKKNELNLSQDQAQVQFAEMKNRLAQFQLEIERLRKKLSKEKEEYEEIAKNIEKRCKIRNNVIEDQLLITNLNAQMKQHIDVIIDTLEHCEESQQHFTTLYNNMSLKQDEIIENLTQQLNDQKLMKKKKLEEQLELKCKELLTLKTGMNEFEEEINEKTQLQNEMNNKIEESKVIIEKNKKRYDEETAQLLNLIKEKESNLKFEKEEKYKLEVKDNEDSVRYNKLFSKYKELQIIDSEYRSQTENLISNELDLKEEQTRVKNELDELKNIHLTLVANKDLELTEFRKELQDSTLMCKDATDKLSQATSKNEELLNTVANLFAENDQLEKSLKNENHEILNLGINLRDLLDKNKKMDEEIQTKNQELITIGKQISENKENSKKRVTKLDEAAEREDKIIEELAMINQQFSNELEEIGKILEEKGAEKIKSAEKAKQLKQDIEENDELITRERKANKELELEIEQMQSTYLKKIQDATRTSKQCESAGHRKQIKEQDNKIDTLSRELSGEKIKRKQANAKKNVIDARDKEKHEKQLKIMESSYENLNKKLSTMKAEYEIRRSELGEAKSLHPETITTCSTPKPILKSAVRESPLKVQKVTFDFGKSSNRNSIEEYIENTERRSAALPIGGPNRPDWANINIPNTSEEPDTTSSVITESQAPQASQPRKFFKSRDLKIKRTSR